MKTAVEFLEKGMEESGLLLDHKWLVDLIEQAKAMEKEQMIEFTNDYILTQCSASIEDSMLIEEYFKLTFKSE